MSFPIDPVINDELKVFEDEGKAVMHRLLQPNVRYFFGPQMFSRIKSILKLEKKLCMAKSKLPNKALDYYCDDLLLEATAIAYPNETGEHISSYASVIKELRDGNFKISTPSEFNDNCKKLSSHQINYDDSELGRYYKNAVQAILNVTNNDEIDCFIRAILLPFLMRSLLRYPEKDNMKMWILSSMLLLSDIDELVVYKTLVNLKKYIAIYESIISREKYSGGEMGTDATHFIMMHLNLLVVTEKEVTAYLENVTKELDRVMRDIESIAQSNCWNKKTVQICELLLINTLLRKQGTSRAELLDALGIKSGNTLTTHINTIKTKMKIIEIREGKFIKYKLELQSSKNILIAPKNTFRGKMIDLVRRQIAWVLEKKSV